MTLYKSILIGFFGSFLMFLGDMTLYYDSKDYDGKDTINNIIGIMKSVSIKRLYACGLLGPICALESYILNEMGGSIYGLCGFSIGATIAVELIGRGNVSASKVLLDAAITAELGFMAMPFTYAFIIGTSRIKNKKPIPKFILDKIMGKDNLSVIEMMYPKIPKNTIKNACKFIYHYKVPDNLSKFSNPVLFWRGSEEPIPEKSENILRENLPQMETEVFEGMGHGQFLHEHPKEYAEKLKIFLENK